RRIPRAPPHPPRAMRGEPAIRFSVPLSRACRVLKADDGADCLGLYAWGSTVAITDHTAGRDARHQRALRAAARAIAAGVGRLPRDPARRDLRRFVAGSSL